MYGTTLSYLAAEYRMQPDNLAVFLDLDRPIMWDAELSAKDVALYRDILDHTTEDGVYHE